MGQTRPMSHSGCPWCGGGPGRSLSWHLPSWCAHTTPQQLMWWFQGPERQSHQQQQQDHHQHQKQQQRRTQSRVRLPLHSSSSVVRVPAAISSSSSRSCVWGSMSRYCETGAGALPRCWSFCLVVLLALRVCVWCCAAWHHQKQTAACGAAAGHIPCGELQPEEEPCMLSFQMAVFILGQPAYPSCSFLTTSKHVPTPVAPAPSPLAAPPGQCTRATRRAVGWCSVRGQKSSSQWQPCARPWRPTCTPRTCTHSPAWTTCALLRQQHRAELCGRVEAAGRHGRLCTVARVFFVIRLREFVILQLMSCQLAFEFWGVQRAYTL